MAYATCPVMVLKPVFVSLSFMALEEKARDSQTSLLPNVNHNLRHRTLTRNRQKVGATQIQRLDVAVFIQGRGIEHDRTCGSCICLELENIALSESG